MIPAFIDKNDMFAKPTRHRYPQSYPQTCDRNPQTSRVNPQSSAVIFCNSLQEQEYLKASADAPGPFVYYASPASFSCNSFSVRPFASFHSIRPLALRPSTTAAAVEGELNA